MSTRTVWALGGAAIALVAVAAWLLWPEAGPAAEPVAGTVADDGAGGVTVSATLQATAGAGAEARFEVKLDTHTVDLTAYDLVANARLEDGDGNRVAPGPGSAETVPGSHHKEAVLVFPRPAGGTLVLVLEGLGGVPERRLVFA